MDSTLGDWAFGFALIALIIGAGKFLDQYHINKETKSAIRTKLVEWFLWLEERPVPDIGSFGLKVFKPIHTTNKIFAWSIIPVASLLIILSGFYTGRLLFGPPHTQSYFSYIINWIPFTENILFWGPFLVSLWVPSVVGTLTILRFFQKASLSEKEASIIGNLVIGVVLAVIISSVGAIISLVVFDAGGYNMNIIFIAVFASIALPTII